ncbi:MAG: hypothetical protein FJX77_01175, partial [Armatimonadetes bacterium]|nr:hypothetical protein [Armatimonadota bacterium]
MSEVSTTVEREERSEQLITVSSGWGALICALLGLHRWVATGSFDWWARLGLIAGLGLAVMWFWGVWPDLMERIRAWSRTGGWNTTGVAIALVVGLIFVNTAVRRRAFVKLDLTKNQRHTLSQRSKEVVKSLTQPVTVTAFLTARADPTVRDRLQQYADETDKFKWVAVDPIADRKTTMAKQPRLDEATLTGAVFEYAGKREDITSFSEKDITSALLKLTRTTKRKIVFLSGHGEPDVTTQGSGNTQRTMNEVVQSLRDVQWEIETLDLYPKDAKTPSPSET